jgi:hypothetical protein
MNLRGLIKLRALFVTSMDEISNELIQYQSYKFLDFSKFVNHDNVVTIFNYTHSSDVILLLFCAVYIAGSNVMWNSKKIQKISKMNDYISTQSLVKKIVVFSIIFFWRNIHPCF